MHNCEDMFLMCIWKGKKINCSEIFSIRKTDNGFCCSFNTLKVSEMFTTANEINESLNKEDMADFYDKYSDNEDNIDYFWSSSESFYGCGGILTEMPLGFFSSQKRKEHLQCEWIIRAPPSMRIHLKFLSFGLLNHNEYKCSDYVSIYDGGSPKFPLLGRYCGHIIPPEHLSTGNQLLIRYKSETSLINPGFEVAYQMLDESTDLNTIPNDIIDTGRKLHNYFLLIL